MAYSRVSRLEEKRTKKQLFWVILGIIAVIVLTITIGIPLIVGASVFLGNLKSSDAISGNNDTTAPLPPVFSPVATATNSANLKIEGYAEPETTLTIFINDEEAKKILLGIDGSFSFTDIILDKGENSITATTTDRAGNESQASKELRIVYKKESPKLEISEPLENQAFTKNQQDIQVKGTTDPGVDIRINDRFVSVLDDGTFIFNIRLNDGENTIVIAARDQAGNETKLERKVTYSPS